MKIAFALGWLAIGSASLADPPDETVEHAGDETEVLEAEGGLAPDATPPAGSPGQPRGERGDDGGGQPKIEEIRVTGQKRDTILQQTPVAISAFSQGDLDRAGVDDVEGLSFQVPSFHYGEVLGAASITIRGVSTAGGEPATAFHIDGVYQANPLIPSSLAFFDVRQVEVQRGPQGTLAGRNATGGAIFVTTNAPSDEFELFGDVQVGSYSQVLSRGVVNIPLYGDKLSGRISGIQERRYGYMENLQFPGERNAVEDAGSRFAIRSQLRWDPVPRVSWINRVVVANERFIGLGLKIDGPLPVGLDFGEVDVGPPLGTVDIGFQDIYANASLNPLDNRKIFLDEPQKSTSHLVSYRTTFSWDVPTLPVLGETTLTLLGGYQTRDQNTIADVDRSNATAFDSGLRLMSTEVDLDVSEWVAEANYRSANDGVFEWVAGLFYLGTASDLRVGGEANFPIRPEGFPALTFVANIPLGNESSSDTSAFAVFADGTYNFLDDYYLNLGLRYTKDWKSYESYLSEVEATLRTANTGADTGLGFCFLEAADASSSDSWDAVTARGQIRWQYRPDKMIYGSTSYGYKAGTLEGILREVGCAPDSVIDLPNTEPEYIIAAEVGSKNQFYDQRLQVNLTGFFYDYTDIQVATLVESTVITQNAADAIAAGLEVELIALPVDELLLTANVSYIYSEFTSFVNGCLVELPTTCRPPRPGDPADAPGPQDFTGNQLPRTPRLSAMLAAQYTLDMGRYGALTPRFQAFLSSDIYFRASNFDVDGPPPTNEFLVGPKSDLQPAYALLDARLTWVSAEGNFKIEAFVDNFLNEDVKSTKLISSPLLGAPTISSFDPPRTWGVRFGLDW